MLGYKQLIEVERAFRDLKHVLDIRPVHHRLPDRIKAHIILCWLALLLVRVAETQLNNSWRKLRNMLNRLVLGDFNTSDGFIQKTSKPTTEIVSIFGSLGLPLPSPVWSAQIKNNN